MLKKPCPYHKTPINHTLEQCDMLKKYYSRATTKDDEAKKDGGDGDTGGFPAVDNVFLIFGGPTVDMSNSQRKRERHEVLAAEKAPCSFLDWSEDAITFSREDHPNSGFYSDSSYEFDFGSDLDEPESENNTTEQPLSGPDRKPADLIGGNSHCVAYLDSLPFQEGTPLAPAGEHTPTEVAISDSSLGSPDRQVFMTTNETPGPSGTVPDQYLEDISADELSANAPADETDANRDA
jgi:hypothetical protein